jgi:hypothetical protein
MYTTFVRFRGPQESLLDAGKRDPHLSADPERRTREILDERFTVIPGERRHGYALSVARKPEPQWAGSQRHPHSGVPARG